MPTSPERSASGLAGYRFARQAALSRTLARSLLLLVDPAETTDKPEGRAVCVYHHSTARARRSIDASTLIYIDLVLMLLVAALSFVNPTNLVARLRENS